MSRDDLLATNAGIVRSVVTGGGRPVAERDPHHRHEPARRDVPRRHGGLGLPARAGHRHGRRPRLGPLPGVHRDGARRLRRGHPRLRPRRPRRHDGPAAALLDGRGHPDHRAHDPGARAGARRADGQRRRRDRRAAQDRLGLLRPGRGDVRDGRVDPPRPQARPAVRHATSRASTASTGCSSACRWSSGPGHGAGHRDQALSADEQAAFERSAGRAVRELVAEAATR